MSQGQDVARVAATVDAILDGLYTRIHEVTRYTREVLTREVPELQDDAVLLTLLDATVTANIETAYAAIRNSIPLSSIEAPVVALEYARRLAQRDIPANALLRAYRIGHQMVLESMLQQARGHGLDADTVLDVTQKLTADTFEYIDRITQRVITTYDEERERWRESRNYVRASHVRDLLDGLHTDVDAATTLIRYPLRRTHVSVVVWRDDSGSGDATAEIERFVRALSSVIGDREACLYVQSDRLTGWAWIPYKGSAPEQLATRIAAMRAEFTDPPHVALGRPLPGLDGFRRSHQHALLARRVALTSANAGGVIDADAPGVLLTGLLNADAVAARQWVGEVLGPLASDSEHDAQLRATLWTFLRADASFKAAAIELHLHFNTVRYRVDRAVLRRGRPIGKDRVDVEVALMLCRLLGPAVLQD